MYKTLDSLHKHINTIGFVNCHAHLDRAYTITPETLKETNKHLFEKWKFVDELKKNSSETDYYNRIMAAIHEQYLFGVKAICTFIDVDNVVEYKALDAALEAKESAKIKYDIDLLIANQTLKPLKDQKNRKIIESVLDDIDIIGGLPGVDQDKKYHFDVICDWAKTTHKRLHVHVDQLNLPTEKETEILIEYIRKHQLHGKVSAIHGISLNCHSIAYRDYIYDAASKVGLSFISCPTAWIDHKRNENPMPWHNATTPVDELLANNITVGLGTDNIYDIYKPFSDGNMMTELRFILESNKIYDIKNLVKISTINGRKILGLK
jgi:cytosine/adenosine deaminase-related metal-dependent hydrolase